MTLPRYKGHRERDDRIKSAITAIKAILPLDLYPAHKRELLGICIWKITEADGKLNTRFRSIGSLEADKHTKLQHEHVLEMKKIVGLLMQGEIPIEEVVSRAVGCVVTKEEHEKLTQISRNNTALDGWKRYLEAGIKVFDLDRRTEIDY